MLAQYVCTFVSGRIKRKFNEIKINSATHGKLKHENGEDPRLIRNLFLTCMTADVSVSGSTQCQAALIDSMHGVVMEFS